MYGEEDRNLATPFQDVVLLDLSGVFNKFHSEMLIQTKEMYRSILLHFIPQG